MPPMQGTSGETWHQSPAWPHGEAPRPASLLLQKGPRGTATSDGSCGIAQEGLGLQSELQDRGRHLLVPHPAPLSIPGQSGAK